jgi:hypothetical protein
MFISYTTVSCSQSNQQMMEYLGLAPPNPRKPGIPSFETKSLIPKATSPRVNGNEHANTNSAFSKDDASDASSVGNKTTFFRQRQPSNASGIPVY